MSHSKPRQISVAGSITNWPGVTPLAARTVAVTVTSANTTRMVFIEVLLERLASVAAIGASVWRRVKFSLALPTPAEVAKWGTNFAREAWGLFGSRSFTGQSRRNAWRR